MCVNPNVCLLFKLMLPVEKRKSSVASTNLTLLCLKLISLTELGHLLKPEARTLSQATTATPFKLALSVNTGSKAFRECSLYEEGNIVGLGLSFKAHLRVMSPSVVC